MKVYRWKHIPTGLFYQPVKGIHGTKSNLSKDGKLYTKKYNIFRHQEELNIAVSMALIKKFNLTPSETMSGYHQRYVKTELSDWICIEYVLVEIHNIS